MRRCNSKIYLKNHGLVVEGVGLAGVWLNKPREFKKLSNTIVGGHEWLDAAAAGKIDQMLSNIPTPEVAEYETLKDSGVGIKRKGWRAIVKDCVAKGAFSWETAKKVFGSGIGESDWDRLDYIGKERALQREASGKDWRSGN